MSLRRAAISSARTGSFEVGTLFAHSDCIKVVMRFPIMLVSFSSKRVLIVQSVALAWAKLALVGFSDATMSSASKTVAPKGIGLTAKPLSDVRSSNPSATHLAQQ